MTNKGQPIWTRSFISVSLTHFMVFVAFYTLLTTLPMYVMEELGGNEAEGGLLVTIMLVSAIIVRPFSGKLLEAAGKKRILVVSVLLFAVTTCLYMWMDQFTGLLVLRFFHGLSFGVATTATGAIAADVIPPARRGEGLGYFAMSMNIAIVVGPFIGLTMLHYTSFQNLFLTLSLIMAAGTVIAFMVHVPKELNKIKPAGKQKWSVHDLFEVKALPVALISCLVAFAYSSIISFISVYSNSLGLSAVSSYFFVVFALVMILSRPYLGRAFDMKGPGYVILPCLLMFGIGLAVLSMTQSAWMLLVSAALIGLGYGSLLPSFQTMAVQTAPAHRSGHATATFFTLYDSGIALGSYVLGLLAAYMDFPTIYLLCAIVPVAVIGLFLLYQQKARQRNKQAALQQVE
ncbi:MFS transporter [Virgibacillus senegalensis]|uniref:MFS transporter n=1 Tax=Virgibacillus senegalensis TaxID=1499679 RepID=UPI00069D0180|nr:MFS transporter [Virgibacillus senegalensis]